MPYKIKLVLPILVLILSTLACSLEINTGNQTATSQATNTSQPSDTPLPPAISDTPTPTSTLTFTPTLTETPTSTPTLTQTATATAIPCNRAAYVDDVTYPDGANVIIGATFKKTWRLMNTGSCSWTSGYRVVFVSGDEMGAGGAKKFTNSKIDPGETVDVSIDLTAPGTAGTYRGYFKLQDSDGVVFGIGDDGDQAFWVEIKAVKIVPNITIQFQMPTKAWLIATPIFVIPGL